MDTRARLKEQRSQMWKQGRFTSGMILGMLLGLAAGSSLSVDLGPHWAMLVISFGLGGLTTLVCWRWMRPKQDTPPSDGGPGY